MHEELQNARSRTFPSPATTIESPAAAADAGDTSYFSWKRWYGTLSRNPTAGAPRSSASQDDVSQQFRRAIQRAREAEASAASSCSSETYDHGFDSPASSISTWDTSASEADEPPTSVREAVNGPTQPRSVKPNPSARSLRATQSVATLKAPRVLRKTASCASLSSTSVELPPISPYSPSSSTCPTATPSASNLREAESTPLASSTGSSFGSRLASSLRRSASSFTLRRSATSREATSEPVPPIPRSLAPSQTAADRLRDLLMQHDAVVDPSLEPVTPLFDPRLARRNRQQSDSDGSSSEDDHDSSPDEAEEALEVERILRSISPEQRSVFEGDSSDDEDDDPFAPSAASRLAWMAPTTPEQGSAPHFGGPEPSSSPFTLETSAIDSPSRAFAPFDPFAFSLEHISGPELPPVPPSPPRRPRAKVVTKKRSFIDPRTRKICTAPQVTVTPSTPERQRTRF